jgi:F-type H+-transporting ATPase subunit alpha
MPVEFQVISILAVNLGFTDKLPVNQLRSFESALHAHLKSKHADFLDALRSKYELSKDIEESFKKIVSKFAEDFAAGKAADLKVAANNSNKQNTSGTTNTTTSAAA